MSVKVLSWNIWGGEYLPQVVAFLQSADADVIGLQEVPEGKDGEHGAKSLAEKLGYALVYARAMQYDKGGIIVTVGNAILSKYPIKTHATHLLSETHSRVAVQADILVGERIVHAFSTHLVHTHQQPSPIQVLQVNSLLALLPQDRTIVMGDFNALPESDTIRAMHNLLATSDKAHMPTWSVYPEGCQVCKPQRVEFTLDYIYTTQDVKTQHFRVEESKGSDHLPISVFVRI